MVGKVFKKLLTEPKEHDQDNFIYLNHGLLNLDCNDNGISLQEVKDKIGRIRDPNQFYRASMIAHLDGEMARLRIGWRGGEVYQVGTYGNVGLIIDPAHDGLVQIAWNCDIGSPLDPEELEKYVQEHKGKIKCPLTLLTQTKGNDSIKYNELILKGDKQTSVKGIFFRSMGSKTKFIARQLEDIVSEIMQTEIPVIQLPVPSIEKYDDIKDPNKRELIRICKNLRAQNEIMQAHLEFYQPELFRHRNHHEINPYSTYTKTYL